MLVPCRRAGSSSCIIFSLSCLIVSSYIQVDDNNDNRQARAGIYDRHSLNRSPFQILRKSCDSSLPIRNSRDTPATAAGIDQGESLLRGQTTTVSRAISPSEPPIGFFTYPHSPYTGFKEQKDGLSRHAIRLLV